jgi:hypothetical protein
MLRLPARQSRPLTRPAWMILCSSGSGDPKHPGFASRKPVVKGKLSPRRPVPASLPKPQYAETGRVPHSQAVRAQPLSTRLPTRKPSIEGGCIAAAHRLYCFTARRAW